MGHILQPPFPQAGQKHKLWPCPARGGRLPEASRAQLRQRAGNTFCSFPCRPRPPQPVRPSPRATGSAGDGLAPHSSPHTPAQSPEEDPRALLMGHSPRVSVMHKPVGMHQLQGSSAPHSLCTHGTGLLDCRTKQRQFGNPKVTMIWGSGALAEKPNAIPGRARGWLPSQRCHLCCAMLSLRSCCQ